MSFADKVKKMVNEAPTASTGTNVNFGPTTFTPIIVRWAGRGNKPEKFTFQEYMKKNGLKSEEDIELEEGKEEFQLSMDMDITVLNPSLDFHFERDIPIKVSNKKNKDPNKWILTSWSEIVEPSLRQVLGKDFMDKILPNGKKGAPVLYLAAEKVDPVEPVREGKKAYAMPKFLGLYKDLDALRKAHDERYPPRDDAEAMAFGPEDEGDEEETESEFPEDVLEQTRDLYQSQRSNKRQVLKMLASQPFGEYEPEALLRAAVPEAFED